MTEKGEDPFFLQTLRVVLDDEVDLKNERHRVDFRKALDQRGLLALVELDPIRTRDAQVL
jgi:hypothetical protein